MPPPQLVVLVVPVSLPLARRHAAILSGWRSGLEIYDSVCFEDARAQHVYISIPATCSPKKLAPPRMRPSIALFFAAGSHQAPRLPRLFLGTSLLAPGRLHAGRGHVEPNQSRTTTNQCTFACAAEAALSSKPVHSHDESRGLLSAPSSSMMVSRPRSTACSCGPGVHH